MDSSSTGNKDGKSEVVTFVVVLVDMVLLPSNEVIGISSVEVSDVGRLGEEPFEPSTDVLSSSELVDIFIVSVNKGFGVETFVVVTLVSALVELSSFV